MTVASGEGGASVPIHVINRKDGDPVFRPDADSLRHAAIYVETFQSSAAMGFRARGIVGGESLGVSGRETVVEATVGGEELTNQERIQTGVRIGRLAHILATLEQADTAAASETTGTPADNQSSGVALQLVLEGKSSLVFSPTQREAEDPRQSAVIVNIIPTENAKAFRSLGVVGYDHGPSSLGRPLSMAATIEGALTQDGVTSAALHVAEFVFNASTL